MENVSNAMESQIFCAKSGNSHNSALKSKFRANNCGILEELIGEK